MLQASQSYRAGPQRTRDSILFDSSHQFSFSLKRACGEDSERKSLTEFEDGYDIVLL
jgi:hypothetical protein